MPEHILHDLLKNFIRTSHGENTLLNLKYIFIALDGSGSDRNSVQFVKFQQTIY